VLAAQLAQQRLTQLNASEAAGLSAHVVWQAFQQVAQSLWEAQRRWLEQWQPQAAKGGDFVMLWFGLSEREPCCQFWAELAALQGSIRALHELPCISAYRRSDGGVCPACQIMAQATWIRERSVADESMERLGAWVDISGGGTKAGAADMGWGRLEGRSVPRQVLATVLTCEDLSAGSRGAEARAEARAVFLAYVDVIRTLATSIRRAAWRRPEFGRLPLLVLLSLRAGAAPPAEALEALQALEEGGLLAVKVLPPAPPELKPSLWGKFQLWLLEEHNYVLYLDADTLLVGPVDDLFDHAAAMGSLEFAAALTRSMASMNTGVMLLRPSRKVYDAMVQSYRSRMHWTGTSRWSGQAWNLTVVRPAGADPGAAGAWPLDGMSRVEAGAGEAAQMSGAWRADLEEQDWRNEFVATHFAFRGELDLPVPGPLQNQTGSIVRPVSCDLGRSQLSEYVRTLGAQPVLGASAKPSLGAYCTLPVSYNFCATAVCLEQLAGAGGPRKAGRAAAKLEPRVLHWPGSLRKPWQRCRPGTRSVLDDMWWQTFQAACSVAPLRAPCQIRC